MFVPKDKAIKLSQEEYDTHIKLLPTGKYQVYDEVLQPYGDPVNSFKEAVDILDWIAADLEGDYHEEKI